jgi:hypothetical protein
VEFDRPVVECSGMAAGHDAAAGSLGIVAESDQAVGDSYRFVFFMVHSSTNTHSNTAKVVIGRLDGQGLEPS